MNVIEFAERIGLFFGKIRLCFSVFKIIITNSANTGILIIFLNKDE